MLEPQAPERLPHRTEGCGSGGCPWFFKPVRSGDEDTQQRPARGRAAAAPAKKATQDRAQFSEPMECPLSASRCWCLCVSVSGCVSVCRRQLVYVGSVEAWKILVQEELFFQGVAGSRESRAACPLAVGRNRNRKEL